MVFTTKVKTDVSSSGASLNVRFDLLECGQSHELENNGDVILFSF